MYVRFETRCGSGLFAQASRFRRSIRPGPVPLVRRADRPELVELMEWLWMHTPVPPRRVYRDEHLREFQTWFHASATAHVERAWRLYELLRRNGSLVRPVRARNPGVIVFRDAVQAVVIPYWAGSKAYERRRLWWGRDRRTIRR